MHVTAILKEKGRAVETALDTVSLRDIVGRLARLRIGAIVICGSGGEVTGIVSERDVVRMLGEHGPGALDLPVVRAMTRNVVTCRETDTVDALMVRMTEGRFRHLPVVEDGALVGIISIGDVVKNRVAEVELEASAMRDYITAA